MPTTEAFETRLERWKKRLEFDFKKKGWWILLCGPVVGFLWSLVMDRVIGATNRFIDAHVGLVSIKPVILSMWVSPWVRPITVGFLLFLLGIFVLVVHAYIETRPSNSTVVDPKVVVSPQQGGINETESTLKVEWKELAARFDKLPIGIRAACQVNKKEQTTTYESWAIVGDHDGRCETLCKYAGTLLRKSTNVLKHASEITQRQPNPAWRWLYFLKDHGVAKSDGLPPMGEDGTIYFLWSITDLAPHSAKMCIDCAAQELSEEPVSADDPQVVINVSGQKLPWLARDKFLGELPVYLQNLGRNPAYRVQIQPVSLTHTKATAIFREVTPLAPQTPVPIRPKLEFEPREEMIGVSEFEVLMQVEWPCETSFDKELVVPMQITYEDHRKRKFRTDLKFGYYFPSGSRTFDFQFTRLL